MATERDSFATPVALTVTLASLASSTSGVGRQSTLVNNATTGAPEAFIFYKIMLGTSPTANTLITFYLLRYDSTDAIGDDGCGVSDAGITLLNAVQAASATTGPSPTTGTVLEGSFTLGPGNGTAPGPEWGLAIVNGSGSALNSTGSNHLITYSLVNPTLV
jgi:hypothetical protein